MLNEIERNCLEKYRAGEDSISQPSGTESQWIEFGLRFLLEAGVVTRLGREEVSKGAFELKPDGSPTTEIEIGIEVLLRDRLQMFAPETLIVGEESGGSFAASGLVAAIDPIDGTWGFISQTGTYATTLAVFRDGVQFLGMVSNPSTGEIGYHSELSGSRLLRMSMFGEPDVATGLPEGSLPNDPLLVNVHPNWKTMPIVKSLYGGWRDGEIQMVRSTGGSPAWALIEAARGQFTYLNIWAARPAQVFDLAAAVAVLRGAGGEILDLAGNPINERRHTGPFVAGVNPRARQKVVDMARRALA